jgi:hypothetical protein
VATTSKKTSNLPPLVEVNPNAQIEKIVTVNKKDPLLVDLKVTNPIVYIKAWWKKVMANEGVDFRFRIRPLTAIAMALVVAGASFGIGWWTSVLSQTPIVKYLPQLTPTPTPNPWKETAFTGVLKYTESNKRYYLLTQESEAITLEVPTNVNVSKLVGKRILAVGRLNTQTGLLVVSDTSDLEILPAQIVPVPVATPTPTPTLNPNL